MFEREKYVASTPVVVSRIYLGSFAGSCKLASFLRKDHHHELALGNFNPLDHQ
jgi:hypothetical protein